MGLGAVDDVRTRYHRSGHGQLQANLNPKLLSTSSLQMGQEDDKGTTWQKAEAAFTGYRRLPLSAIPYSYTCSRHDQPGDADCYQQAVQRIS